MDDTAIDHEEAPSLVEGDALRLHSDSVLASARELLDKGFLLRATDTLVDLLDDLLHSGEFEEARRVLDAIDERRFPYRPVLTGVLTTTRPARDELGDARVSLLERTERVLVETWSQPAELVARTVQRLR